MNGDNLNPMRPESSSGSLIGSIIVVIILIIGAIYLFSNRAGAPSIEPTSTTTTSVDTPVGQADDITALELEATSLQNEATQLDADLNALNLETNL